MHPQRVGERVVAADRDQHVDAERLDDAERVVGEVERAVAVRPRREMRGNLAGPYPARIRPRGVQEGSPGAVDRPHRGGCERLEPLLGRRGVVEVVLEQGGPAPPEADDLVAVVHDPVDDGLDARVEPGHVAAAGEDPDPHCAEVIPEAAGSLRCRRWGSNPHALAGNGF